VERYQGDRRGGAEPDSERSFLGPTLSYQAIESPRHKVMISEKVARQLKTLGMAEVDPDADKE
jgi:hypothetical protein